MNDNRLGPETLDVAEYNDWLVKRKDLYREMVDAPTEAERHRLNLLANYGFTIEDVDTHAGLTEMGLDDIDAIQAMISRVNHDFKEMELTQHMALYQHQKGALGGVTQLAQLREINQTTRETLSSKLARVQHRNEYLAGLVRGLRLEAHSNQDTIHKLKERVAELEELTKLVDQRTFWQRFFGQKPATPRNKRITVWGDWQPLDGDGDSSSD